jgi:hypothetical protein
MFNLGSVVGVCAKLGDRSVKRVYLNDQQIYTCCVCVPAGPPDEYYNDVLYVSDMNKGVCDCSNYNTQLKLSAAYPTQPTPTISTDIYHAPDINQNGVVQGSLYFGPGGYGSMNLPRSLGGAFTVEAWAYREANNNWQSAPDMLFFAIFGGTGNSIYVLAGGHTVGVRNNTWTLNGVETTASAPLNTWQHVALVGRALGNLTALGRMTLYINGIAVATQTYESISNGGDYAFVDLRRVTVGIGSGPDIYGALNYTFPGYIDDLRVTAAARYRDDFSPPVSPVANTLSLPLSSSSSSTSGADPYFQNVEVLLHCDSNCKPSRLRDSSKNNRGVFSDSTWMIIDTQTGNQSPIGNNQSAATDRGVLKLSDTAWSDYRGGPYFQVAVTGNNLTPGTGDYTFEFWGKINGGGHVFGPARAGWYSGKYSCRIRAADERWVGATDDYSSWNGPPVPATFRATLQMVGFDPGAGVKNVWAADVTGILGTWAHIAISRSGGITRVFINGAAQELGVNSALGPPGNPFFPSPEFPPYCPPASAPCDPPPALLKYAPDPSNLDFAVGNHFGDYGADAMALFGLAADAFSGYVDEIRYTKGVGRYASDFSPPITPYPDRGP